mmetsp:Transcript_36319/g.78321  ORF Transcript_36319/g.78321 Transcript_36319/m.78321 type:complete len:157 (-) Transcript_36319:241-711(-)
MQRGPPAIVAALLRKAKVGIGTASGLGLLKNAGHAAMLEPGEELREPWLLGEVLLLALAVRFGAATGWDVLMLWSGIIRSKEPPADCLRDCLLPFDLAEREPADDVGLPQGGCFLLLFCLLVAVGSGPSSSPGLKNGSSSRPKPSNGLLALCSWHA